LAAASPKGDGYNKNKINPTQIIIAA
jgi:hypothetical protein